MTGSIFFDDGLFDIVFSSNIMEHVQHVEEFQQEIKWALKWGGVAVHILPSGS